MKRLISFGRAKVGAQGAFCALVRPVFLAGSYDDYIEAKVGYSSNACVNAQS
jgi:hypothetical protein